MRSIPLVVGGLRTGALILVRDVTELRRRERELMTKDATIREIHHRVKNNLQTVAALLRLQARRLSGPEAREALEEAVRRVGSIAIVHETLSHTPEEIVDFDDIAERVAAMAGELSAPEARVSPVIAGRFGLLPAAVATPLALVLTELLQNALQHGLAHPPGAAPAGTLKVTVDRAPAGLTVTVEDSGVGLPEGFRLDAATSLGLQIVRTLVVSELGGRLEISPRAGGGTAVLVALPLETSTSRRQTGGHQATLPSQRPGPRGCGAAPAEAQEQARARRRTATRPADRPGQARLSRPGRGGQAAGLSSASVLTRHDNHRAVGVTRHLGADRAHRQFREAARAAGAYNQQVGVFRRLDELVGGHATDGPYCHLLLAVAGSCLLDDFLSGFFNLFLGLRGRVELSRDTPDAGSSRGDREDGH